MLKPNLYVHIKMHITFLFEFVTKYKPSKNAILICFLKGWFILYLFVFYSAFYNIHSSWITTVSKGRFTLKMNMFIYIKVGFVKIKFNLPSELSKLKFVRLKQFSPNVLFYWIWKSLLDQLLVIDEFVESMAYDYLLELVWSRSFTIWF